MAHALRLHPSSRCAAVDRIEVEIARPRPETLSLRYVLTGRTDELRLAEPGALVRADELWRHSCFEAFVRVSPKDAPAGEAYYEFNFAPSRAWAAYRFSGYRTDMTSASEIGAPAITAAAGEAGFTLEAVVDLSGAGALSTAATWCLGVAAVIETVDGELSYWALRHPPGRPDFHHADAFALELPLTEKP
ncbi:MAG: DOMON-like domain-containing protein [Maricaulaceae bacterium]|jgi:hypothetical protein